MVGLFVRKTTIYLAALVALCMVSGLTSAADVTPISSIADETRNEATTYSLDISGSFSKPDGVTLDFSATGLPEGVSIDSQSGAISGILPRVTANTEYTIVVTARDLENASSASLTFLLTVINSINEAPTSTAITDRTANEAEAYLYDVHLNFSDPNNDVLSFSASGLPTGVSIDPATGIISGTLPILYTDTPYSITVTAKDAGALESRQTFTLTVVNSINEAPTSTAIADQAADEAERYFLDVHLNFLDPNDDVLSYSASGLPAGVGIDSATGVISGILPRVANSTTYQVYITARDTHNAPTDQAFNLAVNDSINDAPSTPKLHSPLPGSEIQGSDARTPQLKVSASVDVDGNPVLYLFEISTTSDFSTIAASASGLVAADGQVVSWTVPAASQLADNTAYFWRAQATDAYLNSNFMPAGNFFVNMVNDAPAGLALSYPADTTQVPILQPELIVTNATDLDGDDLTYEFVVASDNQFTSTSIMASATGITQQGNGTTAWKASPPLRDNTFYYWKCVATDEHGAYSNSLTATFFTNTKNDAPSAPGHSAPPNGTPNQNEILTLTPTLVVNNAIDKDRYDTLSYTFEVDTVNTFNSGNKKSISGVPEGVESTSWTPPPLSEHNFWYWRAKANDGQADGPWMDTATLFVNFANDAPSVPAIISPADNAEADSIRPLLTVNATDIDQDSLTYEYAIYSNVDLNPGNMVAGAANQGASWTVTSDLLDNTRYFWITKATDVHGAFSKWTAPTSFIVKNKGVNQQPSIAITSPGAVEPVTNSKIYTIRWNASDPDSPAFITLYYDKDNSGNDGTQIVSNLSKDGASSIDWDTTQLADGSYYVYGKIEDGKTSVYAYSDGPLMIDRTPPNVPMVSGAVLSNSATPTWNWNSGGGGGNGAFRYKIDSEDLTTGATETAAFHFTPTSALSEGRHISYVQERDAAGNWSNSGSFATDIDMTPPTATISGAPVESTKGTSTTLTVAGDGVVAYRYRFDGGMYSPESTIETRIIVSDVPEGGHSVEVVGRDQAGNWQVNDTMATWIVDTTPPKAVISGSPSDPTKATHAELIIGGNGVVAYRYRLDDGAFSDEISVTSTISLVSLAEGAHTVSVIGRDSAGNWQAETSATTIDWRIDLTVPSLSVSALSDGSFTSKREQNFAGSVTDAYSAKSLVIIVRTAAGSVLADVKFDEYGEFSHLLTLSEGANTITITATDMSGNENSDTRTITYDASAPQIVISSPEDNIKTGKATIDVKGTTSEASIFEVAIYDGSQTELSRESTAVPERFFATIANLVYGNNTIVVTATDATGNSSSEKRTVIYDNQKPSIAVIEPARDMRTDISILIVKGTVSDVLGAVTVTITQDGVLLGPPPIVTEVPSGKTFETSVRFAENKVYHLVVTAKDEAGNETSVSRNVIYSKPANGDINNDGRVDILDAMIALQISTGYVQQTDGDLIHGDVAPLVNGSSVSDGRIDVGDAVVILEVVTGLTSL